MRRGIERRVRPRYFRHLAIFVIVVTLFTSAIAYETLNPVPSEQFFAMWVLGSGDLAEQYYPEDNPNLSVGQEVKWTLGIHNHMGSIQYVVVRVKLLNSTLQSPDDLTGEPSSAASLLEYTRVLLDNETWYVPFSWKILQTEMNGQSTTLTSLLIDQNHITGTLATAVSGYNYRFVFELWFYDQARNELAFSWRTRNTSHSVWTQIWFNATSSAAK